MRSRTQSLRVGDGAEPPPFPAPLLEGTIAYDEFAKFAMLPNPKGGTAVYPKPITMTRERHQFHAKHM